MYENCSDSPTEVSPLLELEYGHELKYTDNNPQQTTGAVLLDHLLVFAHTSTFTLHAICLKVQSSIV